jgi:hypothetical protein
VVGEGWRDSTDALVGKGSTDVGVRDESAGAKARQAVNNMSRNIHH